MLLLESVVTAAILFILSLCEFGKSSANYVEVNCH